MKKTCSEMNATLARLDAVLTAENLPSLSEPTRAALAEWRFRLYDRIAIDSKAPCAQCGGTGSTGGGSLQ